MLFFSASLSKWHYLFWCCSAILILNLWLCLFILASNLFVRVCLYFNVFVYVYRLEYICVGEYVVCMCITSGHCKSFWFKSVVKSGQKNGKHFIFSWMYASVCARVRTTYQFEFRSKYALHERNTAKYEMIYAKAHNNDAVLSLVYVQIFEIGSGPIWFCIWSGEKR